jgi:hypothetical protein
VNQKTPLTERRFCLWVVKAMPETPLSMRCFSHPRLMKWRDVRRILNLINQGTQHEIHS